MKILIEIKLIRVHKNNIKLLYYVKLINFQTTLCNSHLTKRIFHLNYDFRAMK